VVTKVYLSADRLLEDSFRLANLVFDSGFRPTHIVGIWRGGAPVGIAVQELLEYRGVQSDHIAIRTTSYTGIDDVFDSGRSIRAVLKELKERCRNNIPDEVKVATVYYKPSRNVTDLKPDFFVHQTNDWLIFPHEINGLTEAEIREHKHGADIILR